MNLLSFWRSVSESVPVGDTSSGFPEGEINGEPSGSTGGGERGRGFSDSFVSGGEAEEEEGEEEEEEE